MASIKPHGTGWQARIRRRGYPQQTKTFRHKANAEKWARDVERAMDAGQFIAGAREAERVTLGEALARYLREVTAKKRSANPERLKIEKLRTHDLATRFMSTLRAHDFAALRDELEERDLAPSTVRLYLAPLSHLYTVARTRWGMEGLLNPLRDVAKPSSMSGARDRRLRDGELDLLLLAEGSPPWLPAVITLSIETAMRRGEIASLHDGCIVGRVARLARTKNGTARSVPLSPDALAAIATLRQIGGGSLRMPAADSMTRAFSDACTTAGIEDLRLHDLRHEATSRLFEAGLGIQEVAVVTGHKTWAMLKRYTHPKAEAIAAKLARQKEKSPH